MNPFNTIEIWLQQNPECSDPTVSDIFTPHDVAALLDHYQHGNFGSREAAHSALQNCIRIAQIESEPPAPKGGRPSIK